MDVMMASGSLPYDGNVAFAIVIGALWYGMVVAGTVLIIRLWNSPERSRHLAERYEVVRHLGMHARSVGAAVLAGVATFLFIPGLILMYIDPDQESVVATVSLLAFTIGFVVMIVGVVFVYTVAIRQWPRWIIPPYLRADASELQ